MIRLRSTREIDLMRTAGSLLASSFVQNFDKIEVGTATKDIDSEIEKVIVAGGAIPAFKGYAGNGVPDFPTTTCISIEEEVVHGIPSDRKLKHGNMVGIDAGLKLKGWYADMAGSFLMSDAPDIKKKLWHVTRESLYIGIDQARAGNSVADIGGAIQDYVEQQGFSVIRDLVGHGIGSNLHEEPQVPNYRQGGANIPLKAGMTIAIEPMVSTGKWRIKVLRDGWTAVTKDGSPAGHFEHTVLITNGKPEILTLLEDDSDPWQLIDKNKD